MKEKPKWNMRMLAKRYIPPAKTPYRMKKVLKSPFLKNIVEKFAKRNNGTGRVVKNENTFSHGSMTDLVAGFTDISMRKIIAIWARIMQTHAMIRI